MAVVKREQGQIPHRNGLCTDGSMPGRSVRTHEETGVVPHRQLDGGLLQSDERASSFHTSVDGTPPGSGVPGRRGIIASSLPVCPWGRGNSACRFPESESARLVGILRTQGWLAMAGVRTHRDKSAAMFGSSFVEANSHVATAGAAICGSPIAPAHPPTDRRERRCPPSRSQSLRRDWRTR